MNNPEHLQVILDMTKAVMEHRDVQRFFTQLTESLRKLWDIDAAAFGRYFPEDHSFEVITSVATVDGLERTAGHRMVAEPNTPLGWALKHRRPIFVADTENPGPELAHIDFSAYRPLRSGIGTILWHGDRIVGSMFVASRRPNAFQAEDVQLFDMIHPVLALALENALAFEEVERLRRRAEDEGAYLREEIGEHYPVDGMIGSSRAWKSMLSQARSVAPTDATVLILGETGTGKELVARAIHERSRRAQGPFIKVNCGALTETLIESELFGHERGAFTGAHARRLGRFEVAHGGTLFLDEIGEMPLASQVKLLRVLEMREIERVGGSRPIPVDVRIIAATNRDLETEVRTGSFRNDLFYRLNVMALRIPPLRARREDIPLLAQYFLDQFRVRHGRGMMHLAPDAMDALLQYHWPGNVRELEHLVERAVILSSSARVDLRPFLHFDHEAAMPATQRFRPMLPSAASAPTPLPIGGHTPYPKNLKTPSGAAVLPIRDHFAETEKELIVKVLTETGGTIGGANGAAARLGLKRQTLQSKIKRHGLDPESFRKGAKAKAGV